ncbi:MAG: divergent PAP2 family protein [Patescibacteria group bacterium]|jgi:hypothetical protein
MYDVLLLPILAGLMAQFIKFFIRTNNYRLTWHNLFAYSGMPSMHTAIVSSLATIVALKEGLGSPIFAVSFVLAAFIIRDAFGLRQYLGAQGKVLNVLVNDLKEDDLLDRNYPRLLEKIGHTPAQVAAGAILGLSVSLLGFYFLSYV